MGFIPLIIIFLIYKTLSLIITYGIWTLGTWLELSWRRMVPTKYVKERNRELGGGGQLSWKHRHPGKFRGKMDECVTLTKDIMMRVIYSVSDILIASRRRFVFHHIFILFQLFQVFFFAYFGSYVK